MGLTDTYLDSQNGSTVIVFASETDGPDTDMDHPMWNGPDSPLDERRILAARARTRELLEGNSQ